MCLPGLVVRRSAQIALVGAVRSRSSSSSAAVAVDLLLESRSATSTSATSTVCYCVRLDAARVRSRTRLPVSLLGRSRWAMAVAIVNAATNGVGPWPRSSRRHRNRPFDRSRADVVVHAHPCGDRAATGRSNPRDSGCRVNDPNRVLLVTRTLGLGGTERQALAREVSHPPWPSSTTCPRLGAKSSSRPASRSPTCASEVASTS